MSRSTRVPVWTNENNGKQWRTICSRKHRTISRQITRMWLKGYLSQDLQMWIWMCEEEDADLPNDPEYPHRYQLVDPYDVRDHRWYKPKWCGPELSRK